MQLHSSPEILFLLGSGVSYASGLPSVGQITCRVLHSDWRADGDVCFQEASGSELSSDTLVTIVQDCLKLLKNDVDPYFEKWRGTAANYEDLFYLARQLSNEAQARTVNPAIAPFVAEWRRKAQGFCERQQSSTPS